MPSPAAPRPVPPDDPDRQAETRRNPVPNAQTRQVRGPEWGDDPHGSAREEPWLPHDRDESAHASQDEPPSDIGRQAHEDLARGLQDTDRQPVMERVYRRQKEPGGDRSGGGGETKR